MSKHRQEDIYNQAIKSIPIRNPENMKGFRRWLDHLPRHYENCILSDYKRSPSTIAVHFQRISRTINKLEKLLFLKNWRPSPGGKDEIIYFYLRNLVLKKLDAQRTNEQIENRFWHSPEDADFYIEDIMKSVNDFNQWIEDTPSALPNPMKQNIERERPEPLKSSERSLSRRGRKKGNITVSQELFFSEIRTAFDDFIREEDIHFPKTDTGYSDYKNRLTNLACICLQLVKEDVSLAAMRERFNYWYGNHTEKEKFKK